MAAISQRTLGLVGGVSQQPDSLMIPGQLRECDNFYPDPTFGLLKRPGSKFIRRLDNPEADGSWFYISKGLDDKLILQVSYSGEVKVWDGQSGIEQTVNAISATAEDYATHQNTSDVEVLQINDYVFFLNRNIVVTEDNTLSLAQDPFGYVTVNVVAYNSTYTVTIDGVNFVYNTPGSGSLNVNTIVTNLVTTINANPAYVATAIANVIHIRRANNADFSLEATGGSAGTGLSAYKGTVTGVQDLPNQFLNDQIVKVAGSQEVAGDDYYVKFETSDGGAQGAGTWVETLAPEISVGFDPTTMPHALIKEADGTYTFRELSETAANAYTVSTTVNGIPTAVSVTSNGNARWNVGQRFAVYGGSGINLRLKVTSINAQKQITGVSIVRAGQDYTAADVVENNEGDTFTITTVGSATVSGSTWATQYWGQRTVGDEETAQNPSFVGERISGISFFKNRLVFMSQENVVCSAAGRFFDFYPSTVITVVDDDPIDLSAGATTRLEFRHAIQEINGLVLFADNNQYILQTRTEAFAPSTAELNLISTFSHTTQVTPLDLGTSMIVVEENDKSIAVNELTIGFDTNPLKRELTKVIPSYIPNGIKRTTNSLSASMFGFISIQEPNTVYLFRYYTQDTERLVASWFKWVFPGDLLLFELVQDEAFIVMQCDNEVVLSQINLLTESPGGSILFEGEYIDLRMDLYDYNPSISYDAGNDETKVFFKVGAEIASAQPCLVQTTANDSAYVTFPDLEEDLGAPVGEQYYVLIPGDQTSQEFALGYQIVSEARFPNFYVKKDKISDELNVPMVHRVRFYSHESGPFSASLQVPGRNLFTLTLPQITANLSQANQAPMLRTAENIIPIMAKGTDVDLTISCDAPFPLALVTMIWEGTYNNKGIRSV